METRTVSLSLPANHAATGAPAISGTAWVGATLSADTSPIMDADGLTGVDFTYKWFRMDADGASNEEVISGATAATYRLTAADVGKKVKLQVSFTDNLGSEEMLTGAAFPAGATVQLPPTPVLAQTGTNEVEIWSATVTVQQDVEDTVRWPSDIYLLPQRFYEARDRAATSEARAIDVRLRRDRLQGPQTSTQPLLNWAPEGDRILGTGSYILYVDSQPHPFESPTRRWWR